MSYLLKDGVHCIEFTITGRTDDELGNPLPKIRKTFRQRYTAEVKRYVEWKEWVRAQAIDGLGKRGEKLISYNSGKLFAKSVDPMRMEIFIWFSRKGQHPDPENVFGSIADSLFEQDNNLAGAFDFGFAAPGKPARTEVKIYIPAV